MRQWALLSIILIGCSHSRLANNAVENTAVSEIKIPTIYVNDLQASQVYVLGKQIKNLRFDFPVTINSRVEYWASYFCGRGRKYFEKYLLRAQYYGPYIQNILRNHGLPEDLVYLAMIESGFNNFARSHAKAVGPWQFIAATGKRYGLAVNWWIDERRDLHKSTLAAVGYLKDLYQLFQNWELAAAAYNAGEAKIANAIRMFNVKNFWILAQQRYLKPETRDYVPKMIAAAILSKNREVFGFEGGQIVYPEDPSVLNPDANPEIPLRVLGEALDSTDESAMDEEEMTDEDKVRIAAELLSQPMGHIHDGQQEVRQELQKEPKLSQVIFPYLLTRGEATQTQIVEVEVASPADLYQIASAAGITYDILKSLNPQFLRWCTPPYLRSVKIKLPLELQNRFLANYSTKSQSAKFYAIKAKHKDTLAGIARHYKIRVDPMLELNNIRKNVTLALGTKIVLPFPARMDRSLSSLGVQDPPEKRKRRLKKSTKNVRRLRKMSKT